MYDNLPELMQNFPIGTKIRLKDNERDDYANGKFVVDAYVYEKGDKWYPAHKLWDGKFEIYKG